MNNNKGKINIKPTYRMKEKYLNILGWEFIEL